MRPRSIPGRGRAWWISTRTGRAGFFFSINHLGQIGLHAAVDGQWQGCESKEAVPLLKWSHVAGTFDPETGFAVYVNGRLVGAKAGQGTV